MVGMVVREHGERGLMAGIPMLRAVRMAALARRAAASLIQNSSGVVGPTRRRSQIAV